MSAGVDRSPTRTGRALALGASVAAALALGVAALPSLIVGLPGVATVAFGLRRGRRDVVSVGGAVLFFGALVAGLAGGATGPTLLGAGLAIVAWDAACNAIELGEQVGRDADTRAAELAHVSGTAAVGVAAGGGGYGLFLAAGGERPLVAVVLLSFAVVLLASSLRLRAPSGGS